MARTPKSSLLPSLANLDRESGSLVRQLAQQLRHAVRDGTLKAGEPMPSTRVFAEALGIARGTVMEAFEQLVAEGFLETLPRVGTRVAISLSIGEAGGRNKQASGGRGKPMSLPAPAVAYAQIARQFAPLPPVPFAISVPVGAAAPDDTWRGIGNRIRSRGAGAPAGYGDPQGAEALRRAIAEYVRRTRSVHCNASQVIVTTGTQQGLYLACQVLLGPKDMAWVENPAYRGITAIFETLEPRGRTARIDVDGEGIDVGAAIRQCPDARVAFVTPSHQYPLGMPLSMARRNALLAWARTNGAWVVEDDYDSELRYSGHPFPSLQGLDPDHVVYLGTFSKILFPSLRLGYAVVPPLLVDAFCGARALLDRHPPSADQHVLATFIGEGHLDRHIRRVRSAYSDCRDQLSQILAAELAPELAWLQPGDQGAHCVLWLAHGVDDIAIVDEAAIEGVAVRPLSPMYPDGTARPGLVLGLGAFPSEQIAAATRRLASIIRKRSKRPSARPRATS